MRKKLLEYIKCLNCRGNFLLKEEKYDGEHIVTGVLECEHGDYQAPITGGIPRLLPQKMGVDKQDIANLFGYEWKFFSKFYDWYREQFLDWIKPVTQDFFKGKIILDGGCGKGRHVRLAAEFGAKDVIGADISGAVEVAYEVTKNLPNVHIIQADLFSLPLKPVFDYVYSIGVLDHTTDPYRAFSSITSLLKPGGTISVWVYSKEGNEWITKFVDPVRIKITSRLPWSVLKFISFFLGIILFVLTRFVYKPINCIPKLRNLLFYRDYMVSIADWSLYELAGTVFDHLGPPSVFYLTKDEVTAWFSKEQLKNFQITFRNKNSWRGSGVK